MREILFRGKTQHPCREWIYGSLLTNYPCCKYEVDETVREYYIIDGKAKELKMVQVIPKAVGQFTGLTDKNGKKIFEGDYCRVTRHCILCYGSITFIKGSFWFDEFNTDSVLELSKLEINNFEIEIIGNIHDNPELLKGGG